MIRAYPKRNAGNSVAVRPDKHMQPGRRSSSPQLFKNGECPQTYDKKAEAKWSREYGQSSNSLVESQLTGFAVSKTRGELCSDLCITMQTDCKQVPNLTAFQNKPWLIKVGRTSERNTAVTFNKYLLQTHIQKACLLFCKHAC